MLAPCSAQAAVAKCYRREGRGPNADYPGMLLRCLLWGALSCQRLLKGAKTEQAPLYLDTQCLLPIRPSILQCSVALTFAFAPFRIACSCSRVVIKVCLVQLDLSAWCLKTRTENQRLSTLAFEGPARATPDHSNNF